MLGALHGLCYFILTNVIGIAIVQDQEPTAVSSSQSLLEADRIYLVT